MTYVEIDHPRWIDQFIDYFGESRRAAPGKRRPDRTAALGLRQASWVEYESVRTAETFDTPA